MIVRKEHSTRGDGVKLIRSYSDAGVKIRKVGTEESYNEAIDVEGAPWTYEETEEPVDHDELSDAEALAELLEVLA